MCILRRSGDWPQYPVDQLPRFISRRVSSGEGLPFSILMFLNILSAKPSFVAIAYIISRSFFDSKIGFTICSPHCSERLEATREPEASNCVQAGKRYMLSLRPAFTANDAHVVGCGSATTRSST